MHRCMDREDDGVMEVRCLLYDLLYARCCMYDEKGHLEGQSA